MNDGVRPARPHHKLTEDGRPVREVLSYARRGSRLASPRQQRGWETYAADWVIADEAVEEPGFSWASRFGREAPMIVEIGGGVGEATAALAATRPSYNILSLEVWVPGVAESMWRVGEAGASNVRFCSVDAVWTLEHLFAEQEVAEVWTFFPDPWHKTRHHKRRLVNAENARLIANELRRKTGRNSVQMTGANAGVNMGF